jgi:hypothetical protein
MPFGQGAVQGVGIVPQVDPRGVRDMIGHVAPHGCSQSLSVGHHRLILPVGKRIADLGRASKSIDDWLDFCDNTKCILYVNK